VVPKSASHAPRWYAIPVRVLLITFIGTLACFAISLLLAIIGTLVISQLRNVHPDMTVAYRRIALPAAAAAGIVILVCVIGMEVRHYRQIKALSAIERLS
jgi:hypothetical protein